MATFQFHNYGWITYKWCKHVNMMQPFHSHAWLNNENMCHYDVNMMYSTYVKPFLFEDKHLMGFCNNFRYLMYLPQISQIFSLLGQETWELDKRCLQKQWPCRHVHSKCWLSDSWWFLAITSYLKFLIACNVAKTMINHLEIVYTTYFWFMALFYPHYIKQGYVLLPPLQIQGGTQR